MSEEAKLKYVQALVAAEHARAKAAAVAEGKPPPEEIDPKLTKKKTKLIIDKMPPIILSQKDRRIKEQRERIYTDKGIKQEIKDAQKA